MAQGTTRGVPIDTDPLLTADSDLLVPSQKAIKAYADTKIASVIGTSPIISSGGTTPSISIPQATSSVNGYLSSTDWTTFNSKGNGDMALASAQTNLGAKTFLNTTFLLRNVANTFNGSFTNTNTADRVYTLPDTTTTLAGLAVTNTFTERQTIAAPSLTGSSATSALSITQTLNTSGSPDIISLDFTNTSSGASTNLLNFKQVGGSSLFKITKLGEAVMASAKIGTISFVSNNVMASATASDFRLVIPTTTKALVLSSDYSSSTGTSAILEVKSTVQGFLPPRMTTTQKNAIGTPATGLVVFDTTLNKLCVFVSPSWQTITSI